MGENQSKKSAASGKRSQVGHKVALSCLEERIFNLLVDSAIRKEGFHSHYLIKSNQMSLEELYNVRELPKSSSGISIS
jgi:hypothetical protein